LSPETIAKCARLWPDILTGLAEGLEVRDVLAMAGLSVHVARAYMKLEGEARNDWNDAKRDSADVYFDKVVSIANNPGADPHLARVQADLWRWLAGKRNPRDYSDKSTVDLNVRQTIDLTNIMRDANARLAASRAIEGVTYERITEGAHGVESAEFADRGAAGGRGRDQALAPAARVVEAPATQK